MRDAVFEYDLRRYRNPPGEIHHLHLIAVSLAAATFRS